MADELFNVRIPFVERVSIGVIKQLLDDILYDRIVNDGEKDSILEDNSSRADKARSLIDTVKRKGNDASRKMIDHLKRRDPILFSELGLGPAPEPTVEEFWREKQKDKDNYPVTKDSIRNRVALLITNINFTEMLISRYGAEKDEENMEKLLRSLGYEVVKHTNLTGEAIYAAITEFSKHPKLKATDSVVVAVMSHGELGVVFGVDCHVFHINNIYKLLDSEKCPALLNKPKVIIIQACRGGGRGSVYVRGGPNAAVVSDDVKQPGPSPSAGEERLEDDALGEGGSVPVSDGANSDDARQPGPSSSAGQENIEDDAVRCVHKEKDFISLLSSTPDTVSYRHRGRGCHFILQIVEVLNTSAHKDDIEELFRKVMRRFEDLSMGSDKQMPTKDRCTLTRRFYFYPGL